MLYFIVGSLAAAATAYATIKLQSLTVDGALAAALLILCSCVFGGWFGLVFFLCAYTAIALVDHILKKPTEQGTRKKHSPRNWTQVAANGSPAAVCILLYGITGKWAFLIGFTVALTEALADSTSSDVGIFSKKDPISICRFRRIPRGLSGGISLLGTLSSFGSTLFCGLLYFLFFRDFFGAAMVVLFGNLGCLIDSILGDLLQEKFQCPKCGRLTEKHMHCDIPTRHTAGIPGLNNSLVNLISNTLSAAAAVLALIW